jgi:hypothetical protein
MVKRIVANLWGNDNASQGSRHVGKGRVVWGVTALDFLRLEGMLADVKRLKGSLPDGKHRIKWIHRTLCDEPIFGGAIADLPPTKSSGTHVVQPESFFDESKRTEIYFLANLVDQTDKTEIAFRVSKKQPEIWNPLTGEIADAKAFYQRDGMTIVPLEFAPNGSICVIFRKPIVNSAKGNEADNSIKFDAPRTIDGAWVVSFIPKLGESFVVQFDELIDWAKHPNDAIKHFAGAAIYKKEFDFKKTEGAVYLDLGRVREMVRVRLNGKELGTLWAKPFVLDITQAIRDGSNQLELEVVNHWANCIIGDAKLPESERKTKTNIRQLKSETPLLESGLIGPVQIKCSAK